MDIKFVKTHLKKLDLVTIKLNLVLQRMSRVKYIDKIMPALFLVLTPLLLFRETLFEKTNSFFVTYDNVEQFFPWYQKLASAIHSGYIPIWDANVFGGHSFVGEFQAGAFYPLNIVWVSLFGNGSGIDLFALEVLVVLHFFIANLGAYLLARSFKINRFGSLAAGLIYAYMGANAARASGQTAIFFSLVYLPMALFLMKKYIDTRKRRFIVILGLVLGNQILAGHIQPFFHSFILAVLLLMYARFVEYRFEFRKYLEPIAVTIATFAIVLITAFPQLVLGYQYYSNAYRWVGNAGNIAPGEKVPYKVYAYDFIVEPDNVLNVVDYKNFRVNDGNAIFIGMISVILILALIYAYKRKFVKDKEFTKYVPFFAGGITLTLMIAFGHSLFLTAIMHKVPFLTQVRQPGRYAIWLHLLLSLLIGFGIYLLPKIKVKLKDVEDWHKLVYVITFTSVSLQLVYILFLTKDTVSIQHKVSWVLILIFIAIVPIISRYKYIVSVILLGMIFTNALVHISLINYKIKNASNYPETYFARNDVIDYLENEYGQYRVYVIDFALPKNIGDVYDIQTKLGHGATIYKPYFDFMSVDWDFESKTNQLLNVRYIVSKDVLEDLNLVLEDENAGIYLYETSNYYERIFSRTFLETNKETSLESSTEISYGDYTIEYEITMANDDELIFSEQNYPGWSVYIDGEKSKVNSAVIEGYPSTLRSIELSKGTHNVKFEYRPSISIL